jgi:DNA-directed RNA polymerase specialized sigma24 family protein
MVGQTWRDEFVRMLPALERRGVSFFGSLDPEARDEALQNTRALAWKYWSLLARQGRAGDAWLLKSVWRYAMKQTRAGRTITRGSGQRGKSRLDVYDRDDVIVEHPLFFNCLSDATPVPDAAAFRIDIPAFLARLTPRQRAVALDLGSGMTTLETARKHGVTPGAISQFRTRFKMMLDRFYGAA